MSASLRAAASLLDGTLIDRVRPERLGRITGFENGVALARGIDLAIGAGARIALDDGNWTTGVAVGFGARGVSLLPLAGEGAIALGAAVAEDKLALIPEVGPALLGRVIDPMGMPIDGRGPIIGARRFHHSGTRNPLSRARVREALPTGVRVIDGLATLGVGQRLAIVAGAGVGKTTLLMQMMRGIDADVVVVALIGERAREISDFVEGQTGNGVLDRAVVVASAADAPAALRLRGIERATAIAEDFSNNGKRVLLIVDSLTRVAHAQREIGLAVGEPPTVKGYPPSALAIIPRIVERVGGNRQSGGAITALFTVLADGDELDDPVVDATRSITDGQIVLSRRLAESGVFPAVDIGRTLSRTMADCVDAEHLAAASAVRDAWSLAEENHDLVLIGAYRAGADPAVDRALGLRGAITDFIRQDSGTRADMTGTVAVLGALVRS